MGGGGGRPPNCAATDWMGARIESSNPNLNRIFIASSPLGLRRQVGRGSGNTKPQDAISKHDFGAYRQRLLYTSKVLGRNFLTAQDLVKGMRFTVTIAHFPRIDVAKSAYHHLSQTEIDSKDWLPSQVDENARAHRVMRYYWERGSHETSQHKDFS